MVFKAAKLISPISYEKTLNNSMLSGIKQILWDATGRAIFVRNLIRRLRWMWKKDGANHCQGRPAGDVGVLLWILQVGPRDKGSKEPL